MPSATVKFNEGFEINSGSACSKSTFNDKIFGEITWALRNFSYHENIILRDRVNKWNDVYQFKTYHQFNQSVKFELFGKYMCRCKFWKHILKVRRASEISSD